MADDEASFLLCSLLADMHNARVGHARTRHNGYLQCGHSSI